MDDPLWLDDLSILMRGDRMIEFYPTKDMSLEEKVNSVVRFLIYAGVTSFIVKKDTKPLLFCILAAVGFTLYMTRGVVEKSHHPSLGGKGGYGMHINSVNAEPDVDVDVEHDSQTNSLKETKTIEHNPYGNPMPLSFASKDADRYEPVQTDSVSDMESDMFLDLYSVGKSHGNDRSFYKVPDTNTPNQRQEYLEYVYGNTASGKDWFHTD